MRTNVTYQVPFLRTQRNFPQEAQSLSVELSKTYVDIANFLNARTIGIFTTNNPINDGEKWYVQGNLVQNGLRQVYPITGAGNVAHGINLNLISAFTKIYGTFTDGTNWYPLPHVNTAAVANQISVYVDPTNIVITAGGGAPAITSGYIVLEWLTNT